MSNEQSSSKAQSSHSQPLGAWRSKRRQAGVLQREREAAALLPAACRKHAPCVVGTWLNFWCLATSHLSQQQHSHCCCCRSVVCATACAACSVQPLMELWSTRVRVAPPAHPPFFDSSSQSASSPFVCCLCCLCACLVCLYACVLVCLYYAGIMLVCLWACTMLVFACFVCSCVEARCLCLVRLVVVESQPSESAKGASARRAGVHVDAAGMRQKLVFPQLTLHVVARGAAGHHICPDVPQVVVHPVHATELLGLSAAVVARPADELVKEAEGQVARQPAPLGLRFQHTPAVFRPTLPPGVRAASVSRRRPPRPSPRGRLWLLLLVSLSTQRCKGEGARGLDAVLVYPAARADGRRLPQRRHRGLPQRRRFMGIEPGREPVGASFGESEKLAKAPSNSCSAHAFQMTVSSAFCHYWLRLGLRDAVPRARIRRARCPGPPSPAGFPVLGAPSLLAPSLPEVEVFAVGEGCLHAGLLGVCDAETCEV